MQISPHVNAGLEIPEPVNHLEWIRQHVWIPKTKETPGPFDLQAFPHVEGPLAELNNRSTKVILCMWASRLAKTASGWFGLTSLCVNEPRPSLFTHVTEDAADAAIDEDAYPYLQACRPAAALLPPMRPNQPTPKKFINLKHCRIRRSSAFAPATLRGFPAAYGLGTEISAWPAGGVRDANPVSMMQKRGQLYPHHMKYWLESTPGEAATCQMSALVNAPTTQRRHRQVPCPHCGTYQELVFGTNQPGSPGIKWETPERGPVSPAAVEASAWYECADCGEKIYNEHRRQMMRDGKWVSEGCSIGADGEVTGKPLVDSGTVAFAPLSALHSLIITGWGQIAVEFLGADTPEKLREFHQQTLCLAWDPKPEQPDVDIVLSRLGRPHRIGVAPDWSVFATLGIDCQKDCTHFPWCLSVFGAKGRGHAVEFGDSHSFDEVKELLNKRVPIEGTDERIPILLTLIDSSFYTAQVYQFAFGITHPQIYPCKGSSHPMDKLYRLSAVEDWPGCERFLVNTEASQMWAHRVLHGELTPNDDGWCSLPRQLSLRPDVLEQLTNDAKIVTAKPGNKISIKWERIHSGIPNDYRAAWRYSKAAADRLSQHGLLWHNMPTRQEIYGVPDDSPAPPSKAERGTSGRSKRRKLRRRHS